MKKIININLSGRVIPIEDSAYEKLQAYIESLRRYFSKEESRDEIINDIESRIAELMSEKIRKGSGSIVDADIDEIAKSMGRPEDFEAEAETESSSGSVKQTTQQQQQQSSSEKKARRRLYRDTNDKFIGGVCSGIAAYLNVDPAIIRILFAIVTFGGFGLGFVAYIILWMILPAQDIESSFTGKRLYRNPDDKIIGGVASGLAAYFNKSTKAIRLIFAAPLLFSIFIGVLRRVTWDYDFDMFVNIGFGSLSGTFILAYIILWMVLPEANSTYEKMEMRGEKVDVNTIRQNVKEGMDNMKDRMKTWGDEVKESAQNFSSKAKEFANTRGRTFAGEVGETARNSGRGLGHAIGVLFKVFFLFIAGTIAFGLFVALIALIFGGIAWWPINNFLWTSKWQQVYAWGTLIFFLLVPLIGFITWLFRRIIRVRSRSNYLGWTFGFLWAIGWVAAILLGSSLTKDFRAYDHVDSPVTITQPANSKMIIAVSEPELGYTGSFGWINDNGDEGWDLSDDTLKLSTVGFTFNASKDSLYYVTVKRYSFGRSSNEAKSRASKIQFETISRDSILDLANGYAIDKDSKFRGQQVEIEILVPIGKKIRFDESINDKLNPTKVTVRKGYRRNRGVNIEINDNYWRQFQPGVDYVMGADGNLKDVTGKTVNGDYRYEDKGADTLSVEQQLLDEKRKKDESERKIRELEQKRKQSYNNPESMDDEGDVSLSGAPSPVISLTSWIN
ncbi:MAG TPA: PspC domain-containing protein [Chitinophagaceae bacterium]